MKKNIVTIAIGIIVVLLVTTAVIVIASEDRKAPIITLNIPTGREITYTSGEDKEQLIKYATAFDDKDGDVSDSIKIEDIYPNSDLSTVKVSYVARDKSNNIGKVSQVFKYIASQEEIDNLAKLQALTSETSVAVSATIASSTKSEQATSGTTATTVAAAKPVLTLTQSEATITQGDNFNAVQYVKDITDDKDARNILFTRIIVSGYDANKVGDILINIYCTDTDVNQSNIEKFTLHVKAKKADAPAETQAPAEIQAPAETPVQTPAVVEATTSAALTLEIQH